MITKTRILAAAALLTPVFALAAFQFDFSHGNIAYTSSSASDAIAKLQARMDRNEIALKYDENLGYLPSLLDELKIPRTSQSLVFSKTSLQMFLIAPETPRAIYFNDEVYIGSVQGSPLLEVASMDPKLGAVFYTLSQEREDEGKPVKPRFQREYLACLLCHDTAVTNEVPGLMVLSVLTDRYGNAIPAAGTAATSDRTPFQQRFGGWYATGSHGNQRHLGNMTVPVTNETIGDAKAYLRKLNLDPGANVSALESRFDTKRYLTPHSDLVAQLVLTHQTRIHNLITRARYEAETSGGDRDNFKDAIEQLVRAMLFVRSVELEAPVAGTTSFASDFSKIGPHDRKGRSLREMDLQRWLFRYPLSYLIYSPQFSALPVAVKTPFFARLREILVSPDASTRDFSHLTQSDRQAISEILADTLPEYLR